MRPRRYASSNSPTSANNSTRRFQERSLGVVRLPMAPIGEELMRTARLLVVLLSLAPAQGQVDPNAKKQGKITYHIGEFEEAERSGSPKRDNPSHPPLELNRDGDLTGERGQFFSDDDLKTFFGWLKN